MTTKGPSSDTLQLRRGTAAEWTAADPVLSLGEVGWERDTNELKIGDGSTAWTSLPYFAGTGIVPGDLDLGTPTPPRQQSFLYTFDQAEPNEFTLQSQLSMYKNWSGQALYDDDPDREDLVAGLHIRQDYDRNTAYTGGAFGGEYVGIMAEAVHKSLGGPQLGGVGIYGGSFTAAVDTDQNSGFYFGSFSDVTISGLNGQGNIDTAVGNQSYISRATAYTGTIATAAAFRAGLFLSGATGTVTTAYYYTAYPFNITATVGSIYGYHMRDLRGEATNVWAIRTFGGDVEHDNGNLIMSTDTVTDQVYQAKTTGASFNRYQVDASGTITWGSGAGAIDTNLYRLAANFLKTDDDFVVGGGDMYVYGVGTDAPTLSMAPQGALDRELFLSADAVSLVRGNYGLRLAGHGDSGPYLYFGSTVIGDVPGAQIVNRTDATYVPLRVKGMAAQSGDLQQWRDVSSILAGVTAGGNIYSEGNIFAILSGAPRVAIGQMGPSNEAGVLFGSAADTNLYRAAADILQTDDQFRVQRDVNAEVRVGVFTTQAEITFGTTSSQDVNLYRSAADLLKTDDNFWAGGYLASTSGRLYLKNDAGEISFGTGDDVNLRRASTSFLKTDDGFLAAEFIYAMHSTAGQVSLGALGPSSEAGIIFGNAGDTTLYRSAADTLKTDDKLIVSTGSSGSPVNLASFYGSASSVGAHFFNSGNDVHLGINWTGDGSRRLTMGLDASANGMIGWAPSTSTIDTSLFRSAPGELTMHYTSSGDAPRIHFTNTSMGTGVSDGWYVGISNGNDLTFLGYEAGGDFVVYTDGNPRLAWNSTSNSLIIGEGASGDTRVYRGAADRLETDDVIRLVGSGYLERVAPAYGGFFWTEVSGDTNARFSSDTNGFLAWGPGSTVADTTLYRSAANVLKTDDAFDVNATAQVTPAGLFSGKFLTNYANTGPYLDIQDAGAGRLIVSNRTDASYIPFAIRGMAAQSGDLQRWEDSTPTVLASMSAAGKLTATGLTNSAAEVHNAVVTPAQIVANVNNYNPGGAWPAVSTIRASSDATRTITGLDATGVVDGQEVVFENIGANRFTISPENASSTATNRFTLSGASNVTLQNDASIIFKYDGTSQRWRITGRNFAINTSAPNSVTIDGTNTAGDAGIADARNHIHTFASYSSTPAAVAPTGAAGTSATAPSRGDHSHAGVAVTGGGGETVKAVGATGTTETIALTATDGNVQTMTVDANCVFTMPSGLAAGARRFTLILTDSGGPRNITFTGVLWSGGTEPTAMSGAGAIDTFNFLTINGGTTWYGFTGGLAMAT